MIIRYVSLIECHGIYGLRLRRHGMVCRYAGSDPFGDALKAASIPKEGSTSAVADGSNREKDTRHKFQILVMQGRPFEECGRKTQPEYGIVTSIRNLRLSSMRKGHLVALKNLSKDRCRSMAAHLHGLHQYQCQFY